MDRSVHDYIVGTGQARKWAGNEFSGGLRAGKWFCE
jgi:hypothetical protein